MFLEILLKILKTFWTGGVIAFGKSLHYRRLILNRTKRLKAILCGSGWSEADVTGRPDRAQSQSGSQSKFLSLMRIVLMSFLFKFLLAGSTLTFSGCISFGRVAPDAEYIREDGAAVFIPHNAPSISQGFSPRLLESKRDHRGIDIVGKSGTPVIAPAAGKVIGSYFTLTYGNSVVIDHGKDENGQFVNTRFFHLKKRLVREGDKVARGQQIGVLGMTGVLAGFPHLHYEVHRGIQLGGLKPINPHLYWVNDVGVVTCYDSSKQWADVPLKTTYPVPCHGVSWR